MEKHSTANVLVAAGMLTMIAVAIGGALLDGRQEKRIDKYMHRRRRELKQKSWYVTRPARAIH